MPAPGEPPAMQLKTEASSAMLVVSVMGRLDFGSAVIFQRSLETAIASAAGRPIVVDCSGLAYLSSTGLRSFLIGARAAQAAGTRFLVCGLQKLPAETFEISGFTKVIPVFSSRDDAEAAAMK